MMSFTAPTSTPAPEGFEPFRAHVADDVLTDLTRRLRDVRLAEELPASVLEDGEPAGFLPPAWRYGVPGSFVQPLVARWRDEHDWRAVEERLNAYPQLTTEIDGQHTHLLHVRSAEPDALPLVLLHGWPSSVLEFLDLIGPLTDPVAHGGDAADAFHLVIPSLPGFGFSGPTTDRGWGPERTARWVAELMRRLGYDRYAVHGNDTGAQIAPYVGRVDPEHVIGIHVDQIFAFPTGDPAELEGLDESEQQQLAFLQSFNDDMSGFAQLQRSAPQNLAHALADSPTGQLAWSAQLLSGTSEEFLLANATLYWATNTSASSARFYFEEHRTPRPDGPTTVPIGLSSFAWDFTPLRRFVERDHASLVAWTTHERGSHWAAQDAPDLLTADLRDLFRDLRAGR